MRRWQRGAIAGALVTLAAAAAGAAPAWRLSEGGEIRYVLGFSQETGRILGGGHRLLVPSAAGREPFDSANRPSRLHPMLAGDALRLRREILRGETDQRLFASAWWPATNNGIADRWNSANKNYNDLTSDPDNLSPAEKYDLLFYPGQARSVPEVRNWPYRVMDTPRWRRGEPLVHRAVTVAGPATQWELLNHGVYQRVYPEAWWGHCNGWASYTVAEPGGAPMRDIRVRRAGGALSECGAGDAGCILFRAADIEALMSELYHSDAATVSGRRCNLEPDAVDRDVYGRPTLAACRDVNAATVHVALTGLLGAGAPPLVPRPDAPRRLAFIMDHTADREVWNFPIQRFSVDEIEEVDRSRAMQLVCSGRGGAARCRTYRFNENATRFARVKTRYWMILATSSRAQLLLPASSRSIPLREAELHYVLEMDGAGRILGGEWIRDPAVPLGLGNKALHPDFLWLPMRAQGPGEDADDRGGSGDNPHLSYANVKALLSLANAPAR